jgi:uncharacterized protein
MGHWQLGVLCIVSFVAGTIDAIAGGGGLITLPALLSVGLSPHLALGTNKGQSIWGTSAATVAYFRAGRLDRQRAMVTFPIALVGSLLGASLVMLVAPSTLRPIVLVLLVIVAAALALRRGLPVPLSRPSESRARLIGAAIALVLGAYDGFFGPGTGTFLIVAFVMLLGETMTDASADAKVANLASNLAAMLLFARRGLILWSIALPMALAQIAGGSLGARLAVRGGDRIVRSVLLAVVLGLSAKLARDLYVSH